MKKLKLRLVPLFAGWLIRIWFGTCRATVHNGEHFFPPEQSGNNTVIASFWHYSILYIIYFMRHYPATVMVSASRDGEYIARLVKSLGFNSVRGSRNNQGVQALKGLLRVVSRGESCAVVADGSQGPPMVAQPGSILLASKTGVPVLPMAWGCSSYIAVNSWDRLSIPKPFSKIDFYFGEPLRVPPKIKSEELEHYRVLLEQRLNKLYHQAWEKHGRRAH
ncbi:lysophospholipid acyltransferase family protein [Desulforhopalus singaporensis]|nr:lysophospholipid acyltransferase family protein [Desulforhopalus singaporensis]